MSRGYWSQMLGRFSVWPPSWTDWHTWPRSHAGIDPMPDKMNLDSSCFIRDFNSTRLWARLSLVVSKKKNKTKQILVAKQQNTSNALFQSLIISSYPQWFIVFFRKIRSSQICTFHSSLWVSRAGRFDFGNHCLLCERPRGGSSFVWRQWRFGNCPQHQVHCETQSAVRNVRQGNIGVSNDEAYRCRGYIIHASEHIEHKLLVIF